MINTVIFDIGNVLIDFDWDGYIHSLFPDESIITRFNEAIWTSNLWQEFDRGVMTDEEIIAKIIERTPGLEKEVRQILDGIGATIISWEDTTLPWIRDLKRRGYRVYYLSNYSKLLREQNPEALGFLSEMDGGVFSYEVHLLKPDPAIYRALLEKYDITPSEAVFLDDREDNVRGAEAVGLHAIRFLDHADAVEKLNFLLTNGD